MFNSMESKKLEIRNKREVVNEKARENYMKRKLNGTNKQIKTIKKTAGRNSKPITDSDMIESFSKADKDKLKSIALKLKNKPKI
jgi:hypothetical protein